MHNSGTNTVVCYVDNIETIRYNDTTITPSGIPGVVFSDELNIGVAYNHAVDIDWIRAGPITRQLTGQAAVATGGTLVGSVSGGSTVSISGQVATTTPGTIVPAIDKALTGQSATAAVGTIVPDLGAGVGFLVGQVATTAMGSLAPTIQIGAVAPAPPLPYIVDVFPEAGPGFPLDSGTVAQSCEIALDQPISVVNKLKYVSEFFSREALYPYTPGMEGSRRFGAWTSQVISGSPATHGDGWSPGSFYDPTTYYTDEFTPVGGFSYVLADGTTHTFSAFDGAFKLPEGEVYDCGIDFGGHFSVDQSGMLHWFHSRGFGRVLNGYFGGPLPPYDILYVYQNENTDRRSMPKALVRSQIFQVQQSVGIYAHSHDIVYIFYSTPLVPNGPITGQRATAKAGSLAPVVQDSVMLVGNVATTRQGALGVTNSNLKQGALTGQKATTGSGVITPFTTQQAQVNTLTYRRGNGYEWGKETQFATFVPTNDCVLTVPAVTPEDVVLTAPFGSTAAGTGGLTVVRSGFGNVVYICYIGGQGLGVVVLDAFTEQVYSHTFYKTPVFFNGNSAARSIAQVVALSDGRRITQFTLGANTVNFSWTQDNYLAPTVVVKKNYIATALYPNWDTLEYKGDQVYHCRYALELVGYPFGATKVNVRLFTNDATTGTSEWVDWGIRGVRQDPAAIYGGGPFEAAITDFQYRGYSGYGNGLPSWLTTSVYPDQSFGGGVGYEKFTMWMLFWNGQSPYLSVQAEGQVGSITVTAVSAPYAALTGQVATCAGGQLGVIVGATLGGLRATTSQGTIVPAGGQVFGVPTGQRATTAGGGLGVNLDIPLVGLPAPTTQGALTPGIAVALSGNSATCIGGGLGVTQNNTVPLNGLVATCTPGVITTVALTATALTGASATATPGILIPRLDVFMSGAGAATSAGALLVSLDVFMTGKVLMTTGGTLQVAHENALSGQRANTAAGTPGLITDSNVTVTGLQMTGVLGVYTTNVPSIPPDHHLWVTMHSQDLFATVVPGELYNTRQ